MASGFGVQSEILGQNGTAFPTNSSGVNTTTISPTVYQPAQYPPGWKPEVVWALMPFIILSNILVIVAFVTTRQLRVVANYFVVSLAVSDLFTGAVLIPLVLTDHPAGSKLVMFSLLTTLFMICGCTYDRYVALSKPLHYTEIVTKVKVYMILSICWIMPAIITIIPEAWVYEPEFWAKTPHKVYIGFNSFLILIAIFIQASIYVHIFLIARKHMTAIKQLDRFQESHNNNIRRRSISLRSFVREMKFAKLFAMIGIFYFIFWLPIGYINLVDNTFGRHDLMPMWIFSMSFYTMWLSSLINPTLYALFTKSFRNTLLQWLTRIPGCRSLQINYDSESSFAQTQPTHLQAQKTPSTKVLAFSNSVSVM